MMNNFPFMEKKERKNLILIFAIAYMPLFILCSTKNVLSNKIIKTFTDKNDY